MKYTPHKYQEHSRQHLKSHQSCALFLDMGLGKTSTTLTALNELMFDEFEVGKVLIIAPLKVARDTWIDEVNKWDHLKHLKLSLVLGSEANRKKALQDKADIYVINRENIAWLIGHFGSAFPFDTVIIDELSSFKDAKSGRFKALRRVRPLMNRVIGLTGTPTPNGLIDLWSQMFLLDQGERLGKSLTAYREKYFSPGKRNGHVVYKYNLKPGSEAEIYEKISDICISMKAEDYLELPKRMDIIIPVNLPSDIQAKYNDFEKKQVLALTEREDITAVNAAGLTNKLLQFANGAVYDVDKSYHVVHDEKIDRLSEIIESLNGQTALIFYSYKHDLERILKSLKAYKPELLKSSDSMKRWCDGEIQIGLAHPASAGHGLNLQSGGNNVIWFGLPWSLELYMQANARLHRQGQTKPVIIHRLVAKNTMDEDVVLSLDRKEDSQNALMNAVKVRIKKYKS